MNSIYNKASNNQIIARINNLTTESQPLWGKMNVTQMFKHCNAAVLIAFDEKTIKVNFFMRLLGKLLKKKVFYGESMRKNSPTAKEFIFKENYDFEYSKNELINNFKRFSEGHSSIIVMKHPFWGNLSYEEWDLLMWKHLNHHLEQFGV